MRYNARFGTKMFGEPSARFGTGLALITAKTDAEGFVIASGTASTTIKAESHGASNIRASGTGLIHVQFQAFGSSVARRIGQAFLLIQASTSIDAVRRRYASALAEIKVSIELDGFLLSWEGEEIPCSDDWIETPKEPCNWSDITYAPRQWKQVHG